MKPLTQELFSKFCKAPYGWYETKESITLIGKAALCIYRKYGREEAQHFINEMRIVMILG